MVETIDAGIRGVVRTRLLAHRDDRGSMTEIYRREWIAGMREGVQANLSISRQNVLRGLHFHRKQADYWCVVAGTAFIGLYDLRAGSPTQGKKAEIRVVADRHHQALYIPKGVAHGYYAETEATLLYIVDENFEGGDEFGVAWDDADIGINWPTKDPLLSERDRSNPSVVDVLGDPPPYPI